MPSLRGFRLFVGRIRVKKARTETQRCVHLSPGEHQDGEGKRRSGARARSSQTCVAVGRLLAEQTIAVADVANQGIVINNYGIYPHTVTALINCICSPFWDLSCESSVDAPRARPLRRTPFVPAPSTLATPAARPNMSQEDDKDLDELQSDISEAEDDSQAFHIGQRLTMPKARLYTTQELHSTRYPRVSVAYTDL